MVLSNKIKVKDASEKYGGKHKLLFAIENIEQDEIVSYCSCFGKDLEVSRDELFELMKRGSEVQNFVKDYACMIADDRYFIPRSYPIREHNCPCTLLNHSCEPNCGFKDGNINVVVAMRPILAGEDITTEYNFIETEPSTNYGIICECGIPSCLGVLTFGRYRDPLFQEKYEKYLTKFVQTRVAELKQKWYSSKCYKRSMNDDAKKSLHALEPIKTGELVAKFSGSISEDNHFIRSAEESEATCSVNKKGQVIAVRDLGRENEITLFYGNIL